MQFDHWLAFAAASGHPAGDTRSPTVLLVISYALGPRPALGTGATVVGVALGDFHGG